MSEETLHSAARRVARCCRIDEAHGGLMSIETLQALNTLDIQLEKERKRSETDKPDEQKGSTWGNGMVVAP